MAGPANIHGCCVILGGRGVLIRGASGSGKTTLALGLVAAAQAGGRFAILVSDDQVLLEAASNRLVARTPSAIAGFAEARGAGVVRVRHLDATVVDLIVDLVPSAEAPRVAEPGRIALHGLSLAALALPERDQTSGVAAVLAALGLSPFA